jgi:hypothetical protein
LIGRLPESWIPPARLLDLRARVRTRHLRSRQRTECQQPMHSVLYHPGFPQRRNLLSLESREWIARLKLPPAAREQLDISLVRFDSELHTMARKAARLSSADRPDLRRRRHDRAHHPRRARRGLSRQRPSRRSSRRHNAPAFPPAPTASTTSSSRAGSVRTAPASRSRASCSTAATTSSPTSATRRSRPSPDHPVPRQARDQPMNRGRLPARPPPTRARGDGPQRLSRRITNCRNTPSNIMPPTRSQPGPSAEVSPGARAHQRTPQRAHAPPSRPPSASIHAGGRRPPHAHNLHRAEAQEHDPLDRPRGTSKQSRGVTVDACLWARTDTARWRAERWSG